MPRIVASFPSASFSVLSARKESALSQVFHTDFSSSLGSVQGTLMAVGVFPLTSPGLDQLLLNMQVKLALGLSSEWFGWVACLAFFFWRQIHCLLQLASGKACGIVLSALHEPGPGSVG